MIIDLTTLPRITYYKRLLVLAAFWVLAGCSNIKILHTWKSDDLPSLRTNNVLVVARAARPDVREAFEREIVKELQARDIKATPSYTKFPDWNPDRKITEERKEEIKALLEKEGFNGVVLSVLKDYQELTQTIGEGGYEASVNYGYRDYPTYYGNGFYVYYTHPLSYSTEDIYVPESEFTLTSRVFVLETLAYNLDKPEDQQLLAVVRSSIEDPQGAKSTANDYAKAIAKAVNKSK